MRLRTGELIPPEAFVEVPLEQLRGPLGAYGFDLDLAGRGHGSEQASDQAVSATRRTELEARGPPVNAGASR